MKYAHIVMVARRYKRKEDNKEGNGRLIGIYYPHRVFSSFEKAETFMRDHMKYTKAGLLSANSHVFYVTSKVLE